MLEATPGAPFSLSWKDLLSVEPNMKLRYDPYVTRYSPPQRRKDGRPLD